MIGRFLEAYSGIALYWLKFHLLDHLAEEVSHSAGLELLDTSEIELFNAQVKSAYQ